MVVDERDTGTGSMSVSLDDVRGGELAATHLLERGHREIAFAGSPARVTQVRDRLLGATNAVEAAGTGARLQVLPTASLSVDGGRRVGEALARLPAAERPTASSPAATSSRSASCRSSCATASASRRTSPSSATTTSSRPPGRDPADHGQAAVLQMGRTAAEMLIGQLTGDPPDERHVVFQPELVVRESTSGDDGR